MKTKHLSSIVLACLLIGIFASSCHRNGEKASTAGEDNTHKYNYIKDIHISNPQLALNICDTMETNGEMELFYLDHLRSAIYHNGLKMKRLSHFYGLRAVGDKRFEKTDPESYLFCLRLMAEQDYKDSRYLSAMNLSHQCVDKARKYGFPDTGRGVPADKAEKIFERFYKIDEFVPGVGLGLTLSRAIAAKINATVTLDTSYSGGARFLVAL